MCIRDRAKVYSDTGAFASLGGPVLERACTHAAGPYNYQNFEIEGTAYYTNNPPAGAFRGFGVTQTCFAIESLLDEIGEVSEGEETWPCGENHRAGEFCFCGQSEYLQ